MSAVGKRVGALGAVVVLDVARPALGDGRDDLECRGALELGEDRVVGAAEVVGQHVQPAAVGHPHDDLLPAVGGGQLDQFVEHRHRHVQALDRELVLAEVGLVHEALEGVHLDQPAQQAAALVVGQLVAEGARLDPLAQPDALAVRGDVLDLVGDRAAVGLAQVGDRVGQRRAGDVDLEDLGRDPRLELGRQAQGLGVEARVALGLGAQRVQARGQVAVAAHAPDEHAGRLHRLEHLLAGRRLPVAGRAAAATGAGAGWRGGRAQLDAQRGEDILVEGVLALEVLLDQGQEAARLGALDDPVVVGRGHRHDLLRADLRADAAQADGIGDRAGRDDRALAGHQPRDRGDRADPAGVGEGDVRADEVVGRQGVRPGLLDERVVGVQEGVEAQRPGAQDHRHHQGPAPVLLLDVDRQSEVDLPVDHAVGLAVDLGEVVAHHVHLLGRAGDRVGDQMGEGDLAGARLELLAAAVQDGDGQRAEACRRRDRAGLVHVAGQRCGAASHRLGAGLDGARCSRRWPTVAGCG